MPTPTRPCNTRPVVLAFNHHDPSGASGLQADIEVLLQLGCHAFTVVTDQGLPALPPLPGHVLETQSRALLERVPVSGIKIGHLSDPAQVLAVHAVLQDYPDCPAVLDTTCLGSQNPHGGSHSLLAQAVSDLLLPVCDLVILNTEEAQCLSPHSDSAEASAHELLNRGVGAVLLTGAHAPTPLIHNNLFGLNRHLRHFSWERLEGHFVGAGCTLSAAVVGFLAQGLPLPSACHEGQHLVWQCLLQAEHLGLESLIPNRAFWGNLDKPSMKN